MKHKTTENNETTLILRWLGYTTYFQDEYFDHTTGGNEELVLATVHCPRLCPFLGKEQYWHVQASSPLLHFSLSGAESIAANPPGSYIGSSSLSSFPFLSAHFLLLWVLVIFQFNIVNPSLVNFLALAPLKTLLH